MAMEDTTQSILPDNFSGWVDSYTHEDYPGVELLIFEPDEGDFDFDKHVRVVGGKDEEQRKEILSRVREALTH